MLHIVVRAAGPKPDKLWKGTGLVLGDEVSARGRNILGKVTFSFKGNFVQGSAPGPLSYGLTKQAGGQTWY